jgi:hypothetical protein
MTFGVALLSSQQFFSGASISGPLSKTQSGECLAITIRTQRESRLDFSVLMKRQETDFDIVAAVPGIPWQLKIDIPCSILTASSTSLLEMT